MIASLDISNHRVVHRNDAMLYVSYPQQKESTVSGLEQREGALTGLHAEPVGFPFLTLVLPLRESFLILGCFRLFDIIEDPKEPLLIYQYLYQKFNLRKL